VLNLDEPKSTDALAAYPQTGWTPSIIIMGLSGSGSVDSVQAADGAGPVIWYVSKSIGTEDARTQDKVTVTFSEPIGTNGNNFNTSLKPSNIFRVWVDSIREDGTDTLIEVDTMLVGISDFFQVDSGVSVEFYMTNGNDLTARNYLSLASDSAGKSLSDRTVSGSGANVPAPDNRRVRVVVKSTPTQHITVVPNPTSPTFKRENPGVLNLAHQGQARDWVRIDGKGAVLTFKVVPVVNQIVTAKLLILDMVGNVVKSVDSSKSTAGIVPSGWATSASSTYDVDIYWNCSNGNGMKCAPGIYRAMLLLWYTDASGRKTASKLFGTVGISGR